MRVRTAYAPPAMAPTTSTAIAIHTTGFVPRGAGTEAIGSGGAEGYGWSGGEETLCGGGGGACGGNDWCPETGGAAGRVDDGGIGISGVFVLSGVDGGGGAGAGGGGRGAAGCGALAIFGSDGAFGTSTSVEPTPRYVRAGGRDAWNIGPSVPAAPSGRSRKRTAMPEGLSGPRSFACTAMTRASTTIFIPPGEVSSSVTSAPFSNGAFVSMNKPPRLASRTVAFARSPPDARSYSISSLRAATSAGYLG